MMSLKALAQVAASASKLGGAEPIQIPVLRIFIAVVVCSAFAFCAALLIRHRAGGYDFAKWMLPLAKAPQELRVVEVRRISVHGDVALIEHGSRRYLVLVQAGSSTLLCEEPVPTTDMPT